MAFARDAFRARGRTHRFQVQGYAINRRTDADRGDGDVGGEGDRAISYPPPPPNLPLFSWYARVARSPPFTPGAESNAAAAAAAAAAGVWP